MASSQYSDPYEEWKQSGKPGGAYKPPTETPAAPAVPEVKASAPANTKPTSTSGYQNYQNYTPPQQGYQTPANPTGQNAQPRQPAQPQGQQQAQGFNWTPDANAAQKAYQAWGSPNLGGVNVNDWFKAAVEDGVFLKTGESSSETAYNKSGYSQGGEDITGMRAWAKANGMSEDFDRWDEGQLMSWEKDKDPNCPPNKPYRARDGSGCIEKPIDSNYSDAQRGVGGGGGNGGGGGGGGNGGGGGYGADSDLALYQVKKQYAEALADPTGQKAWELYAGAGGAQSFQTEIDRFRREIAGMPAGPARQAAEQRLRESESSMRLDMPAEVRRQAISGLSGVIQPELGYVGSERDRELQRLLGLGNLDNQRYGMNLNYNLGTRGLDLQGQGQAWNQQTYFPWQAGNAAAEIASRQYGVDRQIQQQNSTNWGALAGQALQQGGQYYANRQQQSRGNNNNWYANNSSGYDPNNVDNWSISDVRMKENIQPGRRGLSDLLKLNSYSYNYKGKPERTQSIMAQDVEKVAPELVKEFDGVKKVDSFGLLGMTMKAVQDLVKIMEKK